MRKFIAIIGSKNFGKSTIIQSLTGCPTKIYRGFVVGKDPDNSIFVVASSPEETPITVTELRSILSKSTRNSRCSGVVMAIQPTHPTKRLALEDIFRIVQDTGRFTSFGFILHPGYNNGDENVREIQQRLRNTHVQLRVLDARRFAYLNATEVQSITKIFRRGRRR